jgi:hypothetical protein
MAQFSLKNPPISLRFKPIFVASGQGILFENGPIFH